VQAERDMMIQQLSAMNPDPSQLNALKASKAEKEREMQQQLAQTQPRPEDLQRQWQQNLDKAKMSGKAVFPAAEASSPTASPTP
jgi:hypothetical protein